MDHIGTFDVNSIRFVDECSFSVNSGIRYYGSSEVGSKALHVSKHDIGINYTLFLMVGLNNKIFAYVTEGPSDSHTYKNCSGTIAHMFFSVVITQAIVILPVI